mmetsp:Transcript_76302/g.247497  ORF Transcript_76302/g.247497 Transcript_76302/m.247497 type:complete len:97 (+) Transcript_76302:92-382(+)|eukprot:CAMPEP_0204234428 /NCGR_PEP_ID=MMETSP0361-20130328/90957_1 /ASSEMBLY_ACC=CAM_ASM_000343 /TAXON_ID=268821 /ORGANISM="Scrippsiella Hangoei, Strain SHTV-5" /LENGTH=96 /DNA_ID=CAMNT_0051205399 /DNA_START=81 /DNA_END=371 /DNA_ORIENTATION=+
MAPPAAFATLSVGARVPQGDVGQLSWNKPGLAQGPLRGAAPAAAGAAALASGESEAGGPRAGAGAHRRGGHRSAAAGVGRAVGDLSGWQPQILPLC